MTMRSLQDLQALAVAELSGAERRGTVVSELTGSPIPADSGHNLLTELAKLAQLLGAPAVVTKRVADLKAATDKSEAASRRAASDVAAAARAVADSDARVAKNDARIAQEGKAHETRLQAEADEHAGKAALLEAERKSLETERAALRAKADKLRRHIEEAA
jgi:chromosome segregation ATPase